MRDLVLLAIQLVVTLAKLLRAGGIRAVIAESLLLKHQILISNRSRQRAPLCSAIIGSLVLQVSRQTITRSSAARRGSIRDASRPRPIWQARVSPPPIDAGILTSGSPRVPAVDLELRGRRCCAVGRGCNALPTISELSVDAARTAGSASPDIHAEWFR